MGRPTITQLQTEIHNNAVEKGFWGTKSGEEYEVMRRLAFIAIEHTRLSKELEAIRKDATLPPTYRIPETDRADIWALLGTLTYKQLDALSRLALIHSEISEAVDEVIKNNFGTYYPARTEDGKTNKPEGGVIELADAVIRCMDVAAGWDENLEQAIDEKMAYNRTRAFKHGKLA